jgi:phosphotransferase system HPr-like phosphotransfer protein
MTAVMYVDEENEQKSILKMMMLQIQNGYCDMEHLNR